MRAPVLNFVVSSILLVSIAVALFAIGAHHNIAAALSWLFTEELPYIGLAAAMAADMWAAFGPAYLAALAAPFGWQPDVLMAIFTSTSAYGTALGYIVANVSVAVCLVAAALAITMAVGVAIGAAAGGISYGLAYLKGRLALL